MVSHTASTPSSVAAAGKHGKPPEESLFGGIEQAITPVHRAAKSLLPGRQVAGAAGQQVQTAFEAGQHGGRRKQLDARRRQFDGQRQAIQASADGCHRGRIFLGEREFALHRLRAFHKKRDRRKTRKHFQGRNRFEVGQRKRWHREFMFAIDVKRRLACDRDLELRPGSEQLRYHRRGGDEVLEVVEQEKHRLDLRPLTYSFKLSCGD